MEKAKLEKITLARLFIIECLSIVFADSIKQRGIDKK